MKPITLRRNNWTSGLAPEAIARWALNQHQIGAPCSVSDLDAIRLLCEVGATFSVNGVVQDAATVAAMLERGDDPRAEA